MFGIIFVGPFFLATAEGWWPTATNWKGPPAPPRVKILKTNYCGTKTHIFRFMGPLGPLGGPEGP